MLHWPNTFANSVEFCLHYITITTRIILTHWYHNVMMNAKVTRCNHHTNKNKMALAIHAHFWIKNTCKKPEEKLNKDNDQSPWHGLKVYFEKRMQEILFNKTIWRIIKLSVCINLCLWLQLITANFGLDNCSYNAQLHSITAVLNVMA